MPPGAPARAYPFHARLERRDCNEEPPAPISLVEFAVRTMNRTAPHPSQGVSRAGRKRLT
jgi:hypothetical protein